VHRSLVRQRLERVLEAHRLGGCLKALAVRPPGLAEGEFGPAIDLLVLGEDVELALVLEGACFEEQ